MATEASNPNKIGSVFDLATKSANIVKENWQMFAVVYVFSILSAVLGGFGVGSDSSGAVNKYSNYDTNGLLSGSEVAGLLGTGIVLVLVFVAVSIFLYAMKVGLEVRAVKGQKPNLNTLVGDGKKYWLRLLGLTLLSGLIIAVGLILLIIPGIIAIIRLVMAPYHMLDKDMGIIDSMKASNEQAKGRANYIVPVILLVIAIAIAASVADVVPIVGQLLGVVLTVAYSLVAVLRYFELKSLPAQAEAK